MQKIIKGMIFKNKDKNYSKPLEILEVLPNNVFRASYDPDFSENDQFLTKEYIERDFIFGEEISDSFI